MGAVLYFVVLACAAIFSVFWVVRLGVRYGVNDPLRMNHHWMAHEHDRAR